MLRSPGRLRAKSLLLLAILLVGGFGLPIIDALWFHSTSRAPVRTETGLTQAHESGTAHLLGCAVWSSPATSTGLPCVPTSSVVFVSDRPRPPARPIEIFQQQTLPTLALPRAPPSA